MASPAKTSNLVVQTMEPDDIPQVIEIDHMYGSQRAITDQGQINFVLGGDLGLSYVAELNGKVVGFLMGRTLERSYDPHVGAWIEVLGVLPDQKRQGIGRHLLEGCRQKGIQEVHAVASMRDTEVKPFREAYGFRPGELVHLHKTL